MQLGQKQSAAIQTSGTAQPRAEFSSWDVARKDIDIGYRHQPPGPIYQKEI